MGRLDNVRLHFHGPSDGGVEVVDLKPQQDAVTIGLGIRITDRTVMVFDLPAVQLED